MMKAIQIAKIVMADPSHPYHTLRDFEIDWKEVAEIAKAITNPDEIIAQATQIRG